MYHLVLSSGTPEVICRDDHDYTALENSIALTVFKTGITLLAYAVMSTHCHIALVCTCPDDFIKILKITYTKHFNSKYRRRGILFESDTYCRPVMGYLRQRVLLSYILPTTTWMKTAGYRSDISSMQEGLSICIGRREVSFIS